MKRLRTILLFLLLGVIINVVVAWGCVLWSPLGSRVEAKPGMQTRVVGLPYAEFITIAQERGFGLRKTVYLWHVPGERNAIWLMDAGWPFLSMYGQNDYGRNPLGLITAVLGYSGFSVANDVVQRAEGIAAQRFETIDSLQVDLEQRQADLERQFAVTQAGFGVSISDAINAEATRFENLRVSMRPTWRANLHP